MRFIDRGCYTLGRVFNRGTTCSGVFLDKEGEPVGRYLKLERVRITMNDIFLFSLAQQAPQEEV